MEKHRHLSIYVSFIVVLGFVLNACTHSEMLPDPDPASSFYVQSGFEFYLWEKECMCFTKSIKSC